MNNKEKEYVRGGNIHACATSRLIKTGGWRVFKAIVDPEKCNGCKLCSYYCPDGCVEIKDKIAVIDYDYCKGCGICAEECAQEAIAMEREEM